MNTTKRQMELYNFIKDFNEKYGFCPAYDDMCEGLGLKSKSGVHRLIIGLESRGLLRRLPYQARSIQLMPAPGKFVSLDDLKAWRRWNWSLDDVLQYVTPEEAAQ